MNPEEKGVAIMVRWYWIRYLVGPLVTFHLQRAYEVRWNRIYGVQVGSWFVGAVRSSDVPIAPKIGGEPCQRG